MAFLRGLFGRKAKDKLPETSIVEHMEYLNSLKEPAIALVTAQEVQFSKIGGLPVMPDDPAWPEWKGRPLAFLCQLDLSQLPREYTRHARPTSGLLYFFYDQEQETWGFDPNDRGSWRVLYTPAEADNCHERERPAGLDQDKVFHEHPIAFSLIETCPDIQDERIESLQLTEKQADEYCDLCKSMQEEPCHRLFGYPSPVQSGDMDLECQLVSHGIDCGGSTGECSEKGRELAAGKADWILLLQLDSDDEAGMMWGDSGMLYFWITKDDLAAGRFENCWMILQCY